MIKDEFVHLHNHTDVGSALDGFGKLDEYLKRAKHLGQTGFGVTDHGTTNGIFTLIEKARQMDLTPVPGCEFYVAPQNPEGAKATYPVFYGPNGQKSAEFDVSANGAYTHQTIWAYNDEGLRNLFKLSTLSNDPERFYFKPRIDFDLIADHSEGLIVASGCPSSEISTRLIMGQDKAAYEYANRMKEVFQDRFFIEVMEHDMNIPLERKLLPKLLRLSKKMDIPLLATNDAHYTLSSEHVHHEQMLCSQSGSRMSDPTFDEGGKRFAFDGNQYYIKSGAEMAEVFPHEDFPGALSNTLYVAEMAQDINMSYNPSLRPRAVVPPEFADEVEYFKHLINEGFLERYRDASSEVKREAKARIQNEFEVVYSSNFIGYFLTVYEYIKWTRDRHSILNDAGDIVALPTGVGRGSVGGSIIAFLLKISEIDPIKHDLLFERFLSAGRGDSYLIEYDDGTSEVVIISEKRTTVEGEDRYIHQLSVGDEVVIADDSTSSVEISSPDELVENDELEVSASEEIVVHLSKPRVEEVSPKVIEKIEKELPREVYEPVVYENLTDLSLVPF